MNERIPSLWLTYFIQSCSAGMSTIGNLKFDKAAKSPKTPSPLPGEGWGEGE
jgi:hypothetical protein